MPRKRPFEIACLFADSVEEEALLKTAMAALSAHLGEIFEGFTDEQVFKVLTSMMANEAYLRDNGKVLRTSVRNIALFLTDKHPKVTIVDEVGGPEKGKN